MQHNTKYSIDPQILVNSGFIEERKQEPAHTIFIFAERHLNRNTLLEYWNHSTSKNTSDPLEHKHQSLLEH